MIHVGHVSESQKHSISGKEQHEACVNSSDSCITNPTATAHEWELSLPQGQVKILNHPELKCNMWQFKSLLNNSRGNR